MKYERTDRSRHDYARLPPDEKDMFKRAVSIINESYERRGDRSLPNWPKTLRIKSVESVRGVWEMTWQWPNGRATFEYVDVGSGEVAIRWRRIGGHEIFADP